MPLLWSEFGSGRGMTTAIKSPEIWEGDGNSTISWGRTSIEVWGPWAQ